MKSTSLNSRRFTTPQYILGFQIAWVVSAIVTTIFELGRTVSIGLMVVNMALMFAPLLVEKITKTKLPAALTVHFLILITAASYLGSIVGFYASVPNWDTYVHLYSGVYIAWLAFFMVQQAEKGAKATFPKWFGYAATFAVSMAVASLWEIYEFLSDIFLHTVMQAGGLQDSMIDMIAALIGTAIALALAAWFKYPKSLLPKRLQ